MARVAVVVVLEGPDAVSPAQSRRGATMAVMAALRAGAAQRDGLYGVWLTAEYINGEKTEYQVFGVDDVNTMIREGALAMDVTGWLFGEKPE